jgi:hypothetical protein
VQFEYPLSKLGGERFEPGRAPVVTGNLNNALQGVVGKKIGRNVENGVRRALRVTQEAVNLL